ncbi:hypothetical protein scyTo_0016455 [Scyliorhinus torazame]|uniref:Uncharacterized protein n=1 Tax=Scyliorhinus torazame TaxID=75743 RepID=A0A401PR91_SCYTO|nr:hypothetical protein [Scyliorhinus torazame]
MLELDMRTYAIKDLANDANVLVSQSVVNMCQANYYFLSSLGFLSVLGINCWIHCCKQTLALGIHREVYLLPVAVGENKTARRHIEVILQDPCPQVMCHLR